MYLLLGVAIVVTALVERQPVKFLTPAEADDPQWQRLGSIGSDPGRSENPGSGSNPYTAAGTSSYPEPQIRSAVQLGFTAPRLFKHAKGGIYQTYGVLMVSPSRQILAVFKWGTTAGIRNAATVLYSALEDGRFVVTSDRPAGPRTPGLYDEILYLDADFEQLVRRHEERLRASGLNINPLSPESPLAEFEAIRAARARFLVASGNAYWVDAEQTAFRATLKGALKTYARTFSTKHVDRSLIGQVR
jgi:hypothetical protein